MASRKHSLFQDVFCLSLLEDSSKFGWILKYLGFLFFFCICMWIFQLPEKIICPVMLQVPLCFPCQDICPLLPAGALGGVQGEAMDVFLSGTSLLHPSLCQSWTHPAKIQANIPEKVEIFTELKLLYKKYPEAKPELRDTITPSRFPHPGRHHAVPDKLLQIGSRQRCLLNTAALWKGK